MSRQKEWQSQLEKSVADYSAPVYELKVSLKHIKPQKHWDPEQVDIPLISRSLRNEERR